MDFIEPLFDAYNPRFERTSVDEMAALTAGGINVNPYTVNDSETISLLEEIGIAGIITDYPQRGTR
jgi:glycerophosphoryl diester phosphodiesterase